METHPPPASLPSLEAHRAWLWLPLALLALAAMALAVDCLVARWISQRGCPIHVAKLIQLSEVFGHGLGVVVLVIVMHQLDAGRRWALPRVLFCSLGAEMAANGVKMLAARTRPRFFDFEEGVLATFTGWLPLGRGGALSQSFPSAHTATAVGFAVALAWLYPRGRWVFATLAILVACQRMQSRSHYLSDVLVGAAIGLIVAWTCLGSGWVARQMDRLESRLKMTGKRSSDPSSGSAVPTERPGTAVETDSRSLRAA
ncbi:MAG: phosphatase PAP2 family protein [Thermoguttaceae bacterium]|nr:phosphatase PAP2 family protein [Thermoguttaceae bacterium]